MIDQSPDLHRFPLFAGMPEEMQRYLQARLEKRQATAGQVILRSGEFGDFLAIVQHGRIHLETPAGQVQIVDSGGTFGEGMLRYGVPSSFIARAEEPTVLWLLPRVEWLLAHALRAEEPPAPEPPPVPKALVFQPPAVQPAVPPVAVHRVAPLSPWSGLHGRFILLLGVLFLAAAILGPVLLPILNQAVIDWASSAGRADLAEAYLELAPVWQPDTADLFDRLGYLRFQQGQTAQAIEAFEKALSLDAHLSSAQNNLAVALLAAGQPEQALSYVQRATELDPGNPRVFYNLGNANMTVGRLEQAARAYQRAFELDPWQEQARAHWAAIAASQGQVDAASQAWQELVARNPQQPLANQGLGMLAVWRGQADQALPYLETARAADPGDPLTRLYLGIALESLDRNQEAAVEYQQVLALSQGVFPSVQSLPFPAGPDLALQAQQRLLGLLPRLAPSGHPSTQGSEVPSGALWGAPLGIQKGGLSGANP